MSPKQFKFHFFLDENFPVQAGKFLKTLGQGVVFFPAEFANRQFPDENVLKYANKRGYIVLTRDTDFLTNDALIELVTASAGIVYFDTLLATSKEWEMLIKRMLKLITPNKMKGKVLKITLKHEQFIIPVRS